MPQMPTNQQLHALEASIRIGKLGLTDGTISECKKQLKNKKVIKVKFLKSSREDTSVAEQAEKLANAIGAKIIQKRGFVVTYAVQGLSSR